MMVTPRCMWHLGWKNIGFGLSTVDMQKRTVKRMTLDENAEGKRRTLYDILGVNTKATHTEIKSAYYTLSMTFHPDKNKDDKRAAIRFREITEAYEVLGSYLKRKRYDQGIFGVDYHGISQETTPNADDEDGFINRKKRQFRSRVPTPMGRTSAYNFDEWTKSHYGKTFQESQDMRSKARNKTEANGRDQGVPTGLNPAFVILTVMSFWVGGSILFGAPDYDNPKSV